MWENGFLVTCAFLGDDVDQALEHLAPGSAPLAARSVELLRSKSKLARARAFATEIDAVKRALDAMEEPWR
ncbi:hypothetical protein BH09MYX1_BH09MYX1_18800 [soil metagenome]